ncbi:hypothetical protein M758_UG176500 [Ceratodon purpureus]|nr:hypothetical protein M758_UG176500 [Ceratodon purpureus]
MMFCFCFFQRGLSRCYCSHGFARICHCFPRRMLLLLLGMTLFTPKVLQEEGRHSLTLDTVSGPELEHDVIRLLFLLQGCLPWLANIVIFAVAFEVTCVIFSFFFVMFEG